MKTQVEVEMEMEPTEDDLEPVSPIVTIEEEEEVVLFWDSNKKSKNIRELAMGVNDGIKEDKDILNYYRSALST